MSFMRCCNAPMWLREATGVLRADVGNVDLGPAGYPTGRIYSAVSDQMANNQHKMDKKIECYIDCGSYSAGSGSRH